MNLVKKHKIRTTWTILLILFLIFYFRSLVINKLITVVRIFYPQLSLLIFGLLIIGLLLSFLVDSPNINPNHIVSGEMNTLNKDSSDEFSKEVLQYKKMITNLEHSYQNIAIKSKQGMITILVMLIISNVVFAFFSPTDNTNFIPLMVFLDGTLIAAVYKIYDTQIMNSKTIFDKRTLYLEKLISLSNDENNQNSQLDQYIEEQISKIGK